MSRFFCPKPDCAAKPEAELHGLPWNQTKGLPFVDLDSYLDHWDKTHKPDLAARIQERIPVVLPLPRLVTSEPDESGDCADGTCLHDFCEHRIARATGSERGPM